MVMRDDEFEEEIKKKVAEQKKKMHLFCLGLFLFFIVLGNIVIPVGDDDCYNVTEVVKYKEIVHDYRFVNEIHYYIYTDSENFDLPLEYFNKLSENDTVVLQKSNNTGNVLLFVDGQKFSNC